MGKFLIIYSLIDWGFLIFIILVYSVNKYSYLWSNVYWFTLYLNCFVGFLGLWVWCLFYGHQLLFHCFPNLLIAGLLILPQKLLILLVVLVFISLSRFLLWCGAKEYVGMKIQQKNMGWIWHLGLRYHFQLGTW